jgi:predicted MPP superfamily phosphohydrolase
MQTLLHLTDLHFGYDDKLAARAQRDICLTALLKEIGRLPSDWKPTIICISGDLVWRAASSDYASAKTWLDSLLKQCNLGYDKVIACVGNHEVNRNLAEKNARPATAIDADRVLAPPLAAHYVDVFGTFNQFCASSGIPILQFGSEQSHLVGERMVNGIRFVVLNSAWCSQDNHDKDKLWLGQPHLQILEANGQLPSLEDDDDAPFSVALMHHPFDWLHPDDHNASQGRANTKDMLAARCRMLLSGHTHGEVRDPDQIAQGALHFTGGAAYAGANYENSFRLIRIEPGQLAYRSFEFDPRSAKSQWKLCEEKRLPCATGVTAQTAVTRPSSHTAAAGAAQAAIAADISRIIKYAPDQLIGRERDTALLDQAWDQAMQAQPSQPSRPRIISFVALGGEGKTSLVAHWALQLMNKGWPGCDAVFAWSFYSQGTEQRVAASSDLFINDALIFFGEGELAASSQSGVDKARRLAQVVGAKRVLLILDGLEPLQYAPTATMRGALKDQALAQLLRTLAGQSLGLCVLTTRYSIPDLKAFWATSAPEHKLLRLCTLAGIALLRKLGVTGTDGECSALVETVQGHALSIHLFGAYLRDAHGGDIRRRDRVRFVRADAQEQGGHAWRVMDAYVGWLARDGAQGRCALAMLKLLGLFDRPASGACIAALLQAPAIDGLTDELIAQDEDGRNIICTRLQDAGLLTVQRDGGGSLLALDAHPLLREYFAQTMEQQQKEAWQAAHRRLYTHLCESTTDKTEPTLEDLQPLYQAVAHGCLAGMQQQASDDVYDARILRRDEFYSTKKLGAFGTDLGAVACFFDQPWRCVSPALQEGAQAWLLGEAAFRLRALGRLQESAEPMRAGLVMDVRQENWKNAASSACNLSELALTLGDLVGAAHDAEQAVIHADRSSDAFLQILNRTTHADALHQAGQAPDATALFCEAEAMQTEWQPDYPLLYSLRGFQYCDLLLAGPESAAWQCSVQRAAAPPAVADAMPVANAAWQSSAAARQAAPTGRTQGDAAQQVQACHAVTKRAAQTLPWAEEVNWLLSIALDHLTLGRAALFAAILDGASPAPCQTALLQAVDGLRRAGMIEYLPHGLLTRAWLLAHTHHHTGPDSAQADLDEAWEIAERGPMPLFMADIHLYRAGLFHHITPYPWQSPADDLAAARRLIVKHGYLRRMAQLKATEQAIGMEI